MAGNGLKPDEAIIKAATEMPRPKDKPALQRLLEMVKYLSQYIPGESSLTAPLHHLLNTEVSMAMARSSLQSIGQHQSNSGKSTSVAILWYGKPVTVQADTSQAGLGTCLMQEGQPVHYASRELTETETRYAQIKRRCSQYALQPPSFISTSTERQ